MSPRSIHVSAVLDPVDQHHLLVLDDLVDDPVVAAPGLVETDELMLDGRSPGMRLSAQITHQSIDFAHPRSHQNRQYGRAYRAIRRFEVAHIRQYGRLKPLSFW